MPKYKVTIVEGIEANSAEEAKVKAQKAINADVDSLFKEHEKLFDKMENLFKRIFG